jgi:capsular exopolysaccharide synthesis family protein
VFDSPWAVGDRGQASAVAEAPGQDSPDDSAPSLPDRASPAPAEVRRTETARGGGILALDSGSGEGSGWKQWLLSSDDETGVTEQFRRLAAALLHGQREGRLKVVMVTSAVPGEGKTLTTLNTALVLAQSYRRRVLLIDADLRRPRLSEAAGLTVTEGLAEALKSPEERKVPVTQLTDYLSLLPAGRPDPEPLSGLTSARMQQLLNEAAERFDWVIVDTPPVAAAADAGLLGAMVDATVLVVKAGETPHPAVRHAIDTIGHDRIFGVVLNGVAMDQQGEYGAYGAYSYTNRASTT